MVSRRKNLNPQPSEGTSQASVSKGQQNLRNQKWSMKKIIRPLSEGNPPPSSFSSETQDSQKFLPPLELLMDCSHNADELGLKNSSVTLPLNSIPASEESPSRGAIVSYVDPLTNRRTWPRKKMSPMTLYWKKKKLQTLSQHFNPIPFLPKQRPLNIAAHQILLTRLGLWDFLNLDFNQKIRTDLIKELVVYYKPKGYYCSSSVHGMKISLGRAALADALVLRAKRFNLEAKGDDEDGKFVVSQEEASFLEELIWGWLVLKDGEDSEVVDDFVLKFLRSMKETRFEDTDWAGLIWFMVKTELSKGKNLVNCYYASHLQLLLKHQRPKLFDDQVHKVSFPDIGKDAGYVKMLELENVLFDEKLKKESSISVDNDKVGLEGREQGLEKENILVKCHKRRRDFFEKFVKEKIFCTEENVMPDSEGDELRKQCADLVGGKFGVKQQMKENQDQHRSSVLYEDEDEKKRGCLTDLGCSDMDYWALDRTRQHYVTGKVPESNATMDSLMNQKSHEGLKVEGSTDLMISVMDDLNTEEIKYPPSNLISDEEGETNLSSGEKVEHVVTGKVSVSYEKFSAEMKHGIKKNLIVVPGKNEDEVEVLVSEKVCKEEVMEVLVNEEICESDGVNSLDNKEKLLPDVQVVLNTEKHASDCDIALEDTDYQERHTNNFSKSGEENVAPESSHINDFQNCASVESMQVTLNVFQGSFGSDNVEEREKKEAMDLDHRGLRLVHYKKEDDVTENKANEAECEANIGNSHDVHCEKEDVAAGVECEANIGNLIDVHCTKKDDLMQAKANEAACEANVGNSLELHCEKEDDVMEDEANAAPFKDNVSNLLKQELQNVQIDLVSEKHSAECMNALIEGVKQEELCLYEYSERGEGNAELQASGLNEFLAAGMDCLQVTLKAMQGKNESDHVPETKGVDAIVWKDEEKDQGKCPTSQGFVLQHCAAASIEEHQVPKEAAPAQYTECDDPRKKYHLMMSLYSGDGLQLTGTKEVICNPPNHSIHHSLAVPLVWNSNAPVEKMIPSVHGKALLNKDINRTEVSVEHFASETEINVNLAGSNCANPMNREDDCPEGGHYGHGTETKTPIVSNNENGQGLMDLDFCTEQVEVWMARLKNAARKKVQANHEINEMLLKKIEEQSQIIQQYEILRWKEQQQKQKDVRKYEREVHLMQGVLQDYRTALKEVHKSFAKYRERCQLPDESLYMDHPGGGGRVILVAKWKKLEQERQKKIHSVINAMMKNFEEEWISKLEAHLVNFDSLCDRLEDLEFAVSGLKAKVLKT